MINWAQENENPVTVNEIEKVSVGFTDQIKAFFLNPKLLFSILIVAVCIIIWIGIKSIFKQIIKSANIDSKKEANSRLAMSAVKYTLSAFAVISVLQIYGINVTSLIAGLGIVGIIVGFALQDLLKDLTMGTNIMVDHFFSVGDVIKYNDIEGVVIGFSMRTTKIKDVNTGNIVTISNRNISEIQIVSDWLGINVPGSYEIPAQKMRAVCNDICEILRTRKHVKSVEFLGTDCFDESQIYYKIFIRCDADQKNKIRREALGTIQDVFEKENIPIPYPQLDVHLDTN